MIRLVLAAILVVLVAGQAEAVTERFTTSVARGAIGNTCTLQSKCTNKTALSLSAAGDIITMEGNTTASPYSYSHAEDMLVPPTGRHGTSSTPITVRASVDGGVDINGQFALTPLRLNGNNWWVFEGFNVRNSSTPTIYLTGNGNNDNIFRRIVASDAPINANFHVVSLNNSKRNTFEDFAAFGTGRKTFESYNGSNDTICRRCWIRWDGSTISNTQAVTTHYKATGAIFENSLISRGGEAMPGTYTIPPGFPDAGMAFTNFTPARAVGVLSNDRLESLTTPKPANVTVRGSIVYVKADAHMPTLTTGGNPGSIPLVWFYGASNMTLTDVVAVMSPNHLRFNQHQGFALTRRPQNCPGIPQTGDCEDPVTGNTATRITSIRGTVTAGTNVGDSFGRNGMSDYANETDWTVTNVSAGTSLAAVQTPWQNTSTNGARVCFRWGTTTPLWPWPMNERIKAATAAAGSYSGPCATCAGERAVRTATDVTADIEELLGTIPASCRAGSRPSHPTALIAQ